MWDTGFQWMGVPLAAALALIAAWRGFKRPGHGRSGAFWAALWTCAALAIAAPDITTEMARRVGIKRGADLLLYCAVLIGAVGFWLLSVQLRKTQRELTLLTRAVAIHTAQPQPTEETDR